MSADDWQPLLLKNWFYLYAKGVWTSAADGPSGRTRVWATPRGRRLRLVVVGPDGFARSFYPTKERFPALLRSLGTPPGVNA